MIFEDIYMIDLYFHKLNQLIFTLNFICFVYRNDSRLSFPNLGIILPKMTQASFSLRSSAMIFRCIVKIAPVES